jgi:hypothetical protein
MSSPLYIFLDEAGNFDFKGGSRYFILTAVCTRRPFDINVDLENYKYDIMEKYPSVDLEYFHCSEDNVHIRQNVFKVINEYSTTFDVYSVVILKEMLPDQLKTAETLYTFAISILALAVINRLKDQPFSSILFITDQIPINKKRKQTEKAVKQALANILPSTVKYHIVHHSSRSHYGLQITDYLNWCIQRSYEKSDSIQTIEKYMMNQMDKATSILLTNKEICLATATGFEKIQSLALKNDPPTYL